MPRRRSRCPAFKQPAWVYTCAGARGSVRQECMSGASTCANSWAPVLPGALAVASRKALAARRGKGKPASSKTGLSQDPASPGTLALRWPTRCCGSSPPCASSTGTPSAGCTAPRRTAAASSRTGACGVGGRDDIHCLVGMLEGPSGILCLPYSAVVQRRTRCMNVPTAGSAYQPQRTHRRQRRPALPLGLPGSHVLKRGRRQLVRHIRRQAALVHRGGAVCQVGRRGCKQGESACAVGFWHAGNAAQPSAATLPSTSRW